jgi:ABC-type polysaccharide/polyol phosphate transport system ATPase subunit
VTEIEARLTEPLPRRLGVGRGTALFLHGTCACPSEPIRGLSLLVDGTELPVTAASGEWWAIVPVRAGGRARMALELKVELADDRTERARLGDVELSELVVGAGSGRGNGAARAHSERERGAWRRLEGPAIAIAMATHIPRRELFERQIASIREQTYENWTCLISDDASDPEALAMIRDVVGDDPRFSVFPSSERLGVYRNFERALQFVPSDAEYVALCDQDDAWQPDKLRTLVDALGDGAQLAYSDMRIVGPDGAVLSETYWTRRRNNNTNFASLLIANTVTGAASMFRRGVLDYALPFPPEVGEQRHDHWLAIVAMALGDLAYVPTPLYDYVQHEDAALGHSAANRGAPRPPGQRMEALRAGTVQTGWREIYFHHYVRLILAATVLRLRCSDVLASDRAKALDRVLASDSPRGLAWLWLRSVRARLWASETMQRDRALTRALVWLRVARWRSRRAKRRPSAVSATELAQPELSSGARAPRGTPLAIEVHHLSKSFRVPLQANDTIAKRILHPRQRHGYRQLPVLEDISFEVGQGEFFGLVGRNGSGKSTLLKLLASIYRADAGKIRVAGQVAPIIELGIGFHPELAARDNVVVNGVMLGLTSKEAAARYDRVMEFAGLKGFETMKLKNYSSGMKVRLAFAIMVEADGDVMMIDEVLAVGDGAFQEKCFDAFRRYKQAGKTVILVSHQMTSIKELCDRALLLENGRIERIGDTDEVTRRYSELAVAASGDRWQRSAAGEGPPMDAVIDDLWVSDESGDRTSAVDAAEPVRIAATIQAQEDIEEPLFRFEIRNENRARLFAPPSTPIGDGRLRKGERLEVQATIENKFAPGPYFLTCTVTRRQSGSELPASDVRSVEFMIPGTHLRGQGPLALEHEVHEAPVGTASETQKGSRA